MTADKLPTSWLVAGAALAALALYLLTRKGAAMNAGAVVGCAVVDLGAGAGLGVGDAVGIPRTDKTACQAAIAEGRWWDASFSCPAGDFLGAVIDGGNTGSVSGSW